MRDALTPEAERELATLDAALAGRPVAPEHAELAELVLLVREERPVPDVGTVQRLDARAARGFAAQRRRRPPWLTPRTLVPALGAVAALVLAVVVVLPGQRGGDDQTGRIATQEPGGGSDAGSGGAAELAPAPVPVPGTADAPDAGASPRTDAVGRRRVERSASLTLAARPRRIDAVADGVVRVTDRAGGFVQSSRVAAGGDSGVSGSFTLRIPTAALPGALADLSRLASVRARSQGTEDITRVYVSARDRVQDARADRARLLRRLQGADTDAEARRLRAELRRASRRLTAGERDLARAANRSRFATVAVELVADRGAAAPGDDGRWTPGDALGDAARVLETAAAIALVSLAVALPLVLAGLPLWLAARAGGRLRRERGLDAV